MGALTAHRQKAVLSYRGEPLISHVLNDLLCQSALDRIWVWTSYRASDVREVLERSFKNDVKIGRIGIIDGIAVPYDYFSHIATAVKMASVRERCLICGIDTRLERNLYYRFLAHATTLSAELCMMASPLIGVAPSHPILKAENGIVTDYIQYPLEESPRNSILTEGWHRTTGTRYISGDLLEEIRTQDSASRSNIGICIKRLWERRSTVRAFIFQGPWKHFGTAHDFA